MPREWHLVPLLAAVVVSAGARMLGWYAPTATAWWLGLGVLPWALRLAAAFAHEARAPALPPPRGNVPQARPPDPGRSMYDLIGERGRHVTRNKEVVRSKPEKRIADFLHRKGVRYVYEMPIEGATPDFYLPDSNIIIEHWGMDRSRYKRRRMEKTRMYRARGYLVVETEKVDVPRLERVLEKRLLEADPHVFERGAERARRERIDDRA